jgi:SAM-dependent methyltransferase
MDLHEVPGTPFRRHPWEVARARFFARVVQAAGCFEHPCQVLDVGAGDGFLGRQLLREMSPGSAVVCVDPHYTDQDLAAFGDPPGLTAGLSFQRTRPAGRFDVVLLLDVIEHVQDDHAFLAEIVTESLAPDGIVLVSVPAWQFLFSQHDVELKHFRRYHPAACRALLESAGLTVVRAGGLFHSLLVPRLLQRLGEAARRSARAPAAAPTNLGQWRHGALTSSLVGLALAFDNRVSDWLARAGREAPGLSYWALCRRALR